MIIIYKLDILCILEWKTSLSNLSNSHLIAYVWSFISNIVGALRFSQFEKWKVLLFVCCILYFLWREGSSRRYENFTYSLTTLKLLIVKAIHAKMNKWDCHVSSSRWCFSRCSFLPLRQIFCHFVNFFAGPTNLIAKA